MKEEIKNLKISTDHQRFWSIYKAMLSYYLKCRKNTESKGFNDKKWKSNAFIKIYQQAKGTLSMIGEIPRLAPLLT